MSLGIVTLQEANMAFLPYESNVFTLDYPLACQDFYARGSEGRGGMAERIADQLATICAMLGEYPAVRYRRWVDEKLRVNFIMMFDCVVSLVTW